MRSQATPAMNRQILDEASAWFVDFRVGDVDAVSRERFDQWLRQSPEHIRAYMEIAKTYVELPALKSASQIDVDALIACARRDANVVSFDASSSARSAERRGNWLKPHALAASLLLAVAGTTLTWLWLHRYPTYSTDIGENRSVTLADGSLVDLNARSRIRVRFSKAERDVELIEGQALFQVAKDAARPFIVRSGAAIVRAVGTQFDVNRGQSGTTVTVVEGQVSVVNAGAAPPASISARSGEGRASYVSAGEQVTVTALRISEPKRADVAAATAWTQHRLIFDGTPLTDVVDEFNRYNSRPLLIEDAALNDFHVSGVYASTDPASLIRFLRAQPGVEVTEADDAVRIRRK